MAYFVTNQFANRLHLAWSIAGFDRYFLGFYALAPWCFWAEAK